MIFVCDSTKDAIISNFSKALLLNLTAVVESFLRFLQFRATLPDSGSLHPCLFGVTAAVSAAAWFDYVLHGLPLRSDCDTYPALLGVNVLSDSKLDKCAGG